MTGFAQVKGQFDGTSTFTLSLKSVNHRFLDLHFRMPSESDVLEMKLRRLLKEKVARGHIELTLSLDRADSDAFQLNQKLVGAYVQAFRSASARFSLAAEPDLNAILRLPGALDSPQPEGNNQLEASVLASVCYYPTLRYGFVFDESSKSSKPAAHTFPNISRPPAGRRPLGFDSLASCFGCVLGNGTLLAWSPTSTIWVFFPSD